MVSKKVRHILDFNNRLRQKEVQKPKDAEILEFYSKFYGSAVKYQRGLQDSIQEGVTVLVEETLKEPCNKGEELSDLDLEIIDIAIGWNKKRKEDVAKFENAYNDINCFTFLYLLDKYCPEIDIKSLKKEEVIHKGSELLETHKEEIVFYDLSKNCGKELEKIIEAIKDRVGT